MIISEREREREASLESTAQSCSTRLTSVNGVRSQTVAPEGRLCVDFSTCGHTTWHSLSRAALPWRTFHRGCADSPPTLSSFRSLVAPRVAGNLAQSRLLSRVRTLIRGKRRIRKEGKRSFFSRSFSSKDNFEFFYGVYTVRLCNEQQRIFEFTYFLSL